jgi:hypothetical protein
MATQTVYPPVDLLVSNMYWDGNEGHRSNCANLTIKPWMGHSFYLAGKGSISLSMKLSQLIMKSKVSIYSYGAASNFGREFAESAREVGNYAAKINLVGMTTAVEILGFKPNTNAILQLSLMNSFEHREYDVYIPDSLQIYIFNKPDTILERYAAAQVLMEPQDNVVVVNSSLPEDSLLTSILPTVRYIKGWVKTHTSYYSDYKDVLKAVYGLAI